MTQAELERRLERLGERAGIPLAVEYQGRRPMIYAVDGPGLRQISPRLTMGEMREWLGALELGIELATGKGKAA